jgi:DNA recombination protein RmuC
VVNSAKDICDKYLDPPHTTDIAIMFLPTEGLYAEILRQTELVEKLQREYRITLAGPTTLSAILSALRMGFRTLAIEKRSSEVWKVLSAVKTEFGKFGGVLDKLGKQLDTAKRTVDETGVRTRAMEKKLHGVEALPEGDTAELLGLPEGEMPAAEEDEETDQT